MVDSTTKKIEREYFIKKKGQRLGDRTTRRCTDRPKKSGFD